MWLRNRPSCRRTCPPRLRYLGHGFIGRHGGHARANYNQDRYQVGDIEKIPFPDNTFDGIVCLGVVEYLASDGPALTEIHRVLKPGGCAVITTPSSICPFFYLDRVLVRIVSPSVRRPACAKPVWRQAASRSDIAQSEHRRYRAAVGRSSCALTSSNSRIGFVTLGDAMPWSVFFPQGGFCRASDQFARNRAVNWLASDQ